MTKQRIGYGRVSTADQNLSSQEDALKAAGCDRVFTDTFTGTKKNRPELNKALDMLRDGDTLVITRLDRLGRSAKDLLEIVSGLEERAVEFQVIEQSIDTKTAEGKLFLTVISGFAEFEREIMRSRTMDGLAAARARGRLGGRPPKFTPKQKAQILRLYNDGMHVSEIMQMFSAARPTIYKVIKEMKRAS
jgi:DNA invertase Pin-like site-specific DNA recombinase